MSESEIVLLKVQQFGFACGRREAGSENTYTGHRIHGSTTAWPAATPAEQLDISPAQVTLAQVIPTHNENTHQVLVNEAESVERMFPCLIR